MCFYLPVIIVCGMINLKKVMIVKCIYCNAAADLTVSDIIPFALTGAKLRKGFVCHKHNAFTNDHYEKVMISQLAIFRNLIGLTERDGDPVRFVADLTIDKYTFEKTSISDKASILGNEKRLFSTKDKEGHKIVVGEKSALLKIKGASEDKIEELNLSDVSIVTHSDIRELFISSQVLHAVAKIAYEWHCYVNDIEEFDAEKCGDIVSYILDPSSTGTPVELVLDKYTWTMADTFSRTGSNMLFEYDDQDGNTYVVFSLWNVILYKIHICRHCTTLFSIANTYNAYFYHVDGTQDETMIGVYGSLRVISKMPKEGIALLADEIKLRLSKLGERDLSREYLKNNCERIKKILPQYKSGAISLTKLLDFEHNDRVIPIYIIEQFFVHKEMYDPAKSFTKNMQQILGTDDQFLFTNSLKAEILQRYMGMEKEGAFISMLESAIDFFETACCTANT